MFVEFIGDPAAEHFTSGNMLAKGMIGEVLAYVPENDRPKSPMLAWVNFDVPVRRGWLGGPMGFTMYLRKNEYTELP